MTETATVETSVVALIDATTANPVVTFTDGKEYSSFYDKLRAETAKHVPDTTTQKGRDAIRSLARRVVTAKTTLDKTGLKLTEDARATIAAVNATRTKIKDDLTDLATEVRRPLTEWEAREDARIAANAEIIAGIKRDAVVALDDTAASVEARGRAVHVLSFDGPEWTETERELARGEQDHAVKLLLAARARLTQEEADRAELARLRAEAEERAARDAEAAAQRETEAAEARAKEEAAAAVERAAVAAREAEERERQRIADAEKRAAEQAAQAERDAAEVERKRVEAQHAAEIAAERARTAEIERQQQAERDRIAAADAAREAQEREVKRQAEEIAAAAAKREADRAHVARVMGEAKMAIMSCGVSEDHARAIVVAIKGGLVPAVGITF